MNGSTTIAPLATPERKGADRPPVLVYDNVR